MLRETKYSFKDEDQTIWDLLTFTMIVLRSDISLNPTRPDAIALFTWLSCIYNINQTEKWYIKGAE